MKNWRSFYYRGNYITPDPAEPHLRSFIFYRFIQQNGLAKQIVNRIHKMGRNAQGQLLIFFNISISSLLLFKCTMALVVKGKTVCNVI